MRRLDMMMEVRAINGYILCVGISIMGNSYRKTATIDSYVHDWDSINKVWNSLTSDIINIDEIYSSTYKNFFTEVTKGLTLEV